MHRPKNVALVALCIMGMSSVAHASLSLALPYLKQEHNLSCEASALRMVLRFHSVDVSEDVVLEKMPHDPTPRSGDVWGDPDLGFVGDVDGEMAETGYGIHWKGLAKTASKWMKTRIIEHGTIRDLVEELDKRRPVIAWGVHGSFRKLSWKTPAGRTVSAFHSEHTRVVYGYEGDRNSPTGFHVMDTLEGPRLWNTSEFLKNWDSFGRKGLVVYP